MKWFDDKVEKGHRDRVLQAAKSELAKLESAPERRFFFAQMATALGAAVVGVVIFKRAPSDSKPTQDPFLEADLDPQMLNELGLVQDLDFWQNLDLLENAKELGEDA